MCIINIFTLKKLQVAYLQAQVMQAKAQLAQNLVETQTQTQTQSSISRNGGGGENQWNGGGMGSGSGSPPFPYSGNYNNYSSPQSSVDDGREEDEATFHHQYYNTKKRPSQTDLTDLQALALRIMNNNHN